MFKIFETPIPKRELSDFYKIPSEYPNLAYILINTQENKLNGITYPSTGDLYCISDKEGLEQLHKTANELENRGIRVLVCDYPLENDMGVLE